ncbi:MAG: hypothetical protein GX760_05570 [Erysipelothrix sp.]|nr:hypothetical protein [Erysipelothrix sp.]
MQKRYTDMLEKTVAYQISLPEFKEANLELNERHVIEAAIEHYHAQVFGEDVMSFVIPQMADELSLKIDLKLNHFVEKMAQVFNALMLKGDINKEMLGVLLQLNGFSAQQIRDGAESNLDQVLEDNSVIFKEVDQAVLKKIK